MFDLRSIVIGSILMLRKYTCVDITIYAESNDEDYKNGIYVLPIIGFVIGFVALLMSSLRAFYDGLFVSVIILSFYNIVTKTTNMKEAYRTLNYYIKPINQTEQLPAIIGILLINLVYFSLFPLVPPTALAITFVAGFSSPIILSSVINRKKDNTFIMKYCSKNHVIGAFGLSFLLAAIINYRLVISLSLTYMVLGFIVSILDERIKVLPSSVEGFFIEITQVLFLIFTYMMKL
jgi:cobalamin synthase